MNSALVSRFEHKMMNEILEVIKIGPVKRQDLIAKFRNKYLVDKALNILEQMGFIKKEVVLQDKGGRPFHLYRYVPEETKEINRNNLESKVKKER